MRDVVVVIATYNEADNIRQVLDGLQEYQVVVVDDNSPDETGRIAAEYENVRVINRTGKLGIASAYLCGFQYALQHYDPKFIVQMDAGLTHNPRNVAQLIREAEVHCADLVIGSRFIIAPHLKSYRTMISLGAGWLMRRLGVWAHDATSGFRCWRSTLLSDILYRYEPKATGFAFQLEMLYRARWLTGSRQGEIIEMPMHYALSNSTFKPAMLWEALRVYAGLWRNHFFGGAQ